MRKINLTILVSSLTIGGAEQLLLELLRNINAERFRVNICFLRTPGLLGAEILRLNFPVSTGILNSRFDPAGILRLAKLFKEQKTDLLFLINHRNTLFYGVLAAWLAGVRAIVNWQNETFLKYNYHAITMLGRRILHKGVGKVVAAAKGHGDYIATVEKIPAHKIAVIYNGVDPHRFDSSLSPGEARAKLGIPEDCPVISIIAVLRPDKAHGIFLKAAQSVLKEIPEAHFLIVGDGPERNRLTELAGELQISSSVHFLGFRRDLGAILAAVDINTLSSNPEQETLSVAAIEAMSVGVPIVCTDVGSMREVVIPGKTGFLVPVADPQALACRLLELLKDPPARKKMGEEARKLVHEELSAKKMASTFEDLFTELYKGQSQN